MSAPDRMEPELVAIPSAHAQTFTHARLFLRRVFFFPSAFIYVKRRIDTKENKNESIQFSTSFKDRKKKSGFRVFS